MCGVPADGCVVVQATMHVCVGVGSNLRLTRLCSCVKPRLYRTWENYRRALQRLPTTVGESVSVRPAQNFYFRLTSVL